MITPFCTATPKSAMNPTALETLSVMPRANSATIPPSSASGTVAMMIAA